MKNKHYTNYAAKARRCAMLVFLLLAGTLTNLVAQVSTYQFSQSMGTYAPITGGTVLTAVGNEDDNTYLVTLPFSFDFNNATYTDIYVSANGYISFGTTDPGTGTRSAISSTAAVNGIAASFSADLQGGFVCTGNRTLGNDTLKNVNSTAGIVDGLVISGTGIPVGTTVVSHTANTIVMSATATSTGTGTTLTHNSGEIRVEDLGSEFVIQWSNWKRFTSSGATADNNNFQIRLNPSDYSINFVYGANSSVSTTSVTRQVGLRGATNTDFFNRSTTTNWSATTQGASNTASCSFRNTIFPANGLTFTFLPPDLCTTADGGTITPSSAARCLNQSYAMSATGVSQGTGTSYQWQVSETPGGPYTDVTTGTGGTTTSYNTGALTVPGVYYYVLKTTCANCGPCDDISNELVLTVNALPVVEVTPDASSICQPGATAVTLTATGAVTYAWSPSAGLSATTGDVVDALPAATTNYTVTGTDANGCTAQDVAAITVNAGVNIASVTAVPSSVCSGGSTTLTANLGAAGNYCLPAYTSSDGTDFLGKVELLDEFAAQLFIRNSGHTALPSYDNQLATNVGTFNAGTNYQISVTIGGSAGNTAAFIDFNHDGDFLDAGEAIMTSASVVANGTRTVAFSIPAGAYNGTTRLRVVERFSSAAASCNTSGFGETEDYSITIANGVESVTYAWSETGSTLNSNNINPTTASNITGDVTYTVVVTAGNGCSATEDVLVNVGTPIVCDSISYSNACGGENFTVTAHTSGGGGLFSYAWSDGMGGVYPDAAAITANLAAGNYNFSVTITDGCGSICNMNLVVTVGAAPGGSANGPSTGETYQELVYIVSGYEAGSSIDWQFATALAGPYSSLAISTDTAVLEASSAGTFYVQAVVTGSNGCQSVAGPIATVVTVDGDNVCDAIPLVVGSVNGPFTNQGATVESGEAQPPLTGCSGQAGWCAAPNGTINNTVWFSFVAPSNGRVSIHFSPANWDSEIALWSAASCSDLLSGAGTLLAANDDSASTPFNAWIAPICLNPGQTYYVQVDGYSNTVNSAFGLYILEHANPLTDTWYADLDGDTYGDLNNTYVQCSAPSGYVANSTDCDDMNAMVNPGATELCNAIDDDCDGNIDEGTQPGAGAISGSPTSLCWPTAPGIGSYSVPVDPLATTYTWTVPAGMFITGGQGTNSISIQWTAAAANTGIVGNVTCVASNSCFSGPQSVYPVSITTVKPVTPGSISGPAKVCPGDAVVYSVATVARASFYQWTLPAGLTIVGPATGNIVNVSVDGSFAGGTLSVQAGNACGLSPNRNKGLSFNNPLVPGPISGQASGVCGNVGEVYSIGSVANALSYQWSVGAGGSIPGSSTGTMVAVDYSGSLASTVLSVSSVNGCGTSAPRNLTITGAPGVPSPITGPVSVCTGATDHYSVNTVVGATSYDWTAPGTVVFGQGTKEVDIMWGSSPSSGQQILVRASNDCGDGPLRTLGGISINFCPRVSGTELDAELAAYPNPATDLVTVTFSMENSFVMKLNDVTGRNVMTVANEASGAHTEVIDVSKLNSGVYFLVLQTTEGSQQIRLVVE